MTAIPSTAPRSTKPRWRRWSHASGRALRGVLRLEDTPQRIALGSALGLFFAFQPFVGSQMLVAAVVARVVGGNVLASVPWTWITNPLTLLPFWYAIYCIGCTWWPAARQFDVQRLDELSAAIEAVGPWSVITGQQADLLPLLLDVIAPMQLGGTALGGISAGLGYVAVRRLVRAVQARRAARRAGWRRQAVPPVPMPG